LNLEDRKKKDFPFLLDKTKLFNNTSSKKNFLTDLTSALQQKFCLFYIGLVIEKNWQDADCSSSKNALLKEFPQCKVMICFGHCHPKCNDSEYFCYGTSQELTT